MKTLSFDTKTGAWVSRAIFTALTAVLSQISVPLWPVPINLALLSVFMSGGLLGASGGAVSQIIFLLLGLVGAPVFSGFNGGAGALLGPTGGYIIGYVLTAWLSGFFWERRKTRASLLVGMTAGLVVCYALGTAWFMFITSSGFSRALSLCVFPFLIGDALKIAAATTLTLRVNRAIGDIKQRKKADNVKF
jgi:biotin transport system substrate-specific component